MLVPGELRSPVHPRPRAKSETIQILKPAEKKAKYPYGAMNMGGRPVTPPRKQKKKGEK